MPSLPELPEVAFIGGTGPEGRGLARRFAMLGHRVHIGSRSAERAREAAQSITDASQPVAPEGTTNRDAAARADIVILTIPYAAAADTLPPLADAVQAKIVVSAIAPIEFREGRPTIVPVRTGSAAQDVQTMLPSARVVSAFQTVDAHTLLHGDAALDTDVVVCSDDQEARREIMALARTLDGVRALSGGRLAASRFVEESTALLITLNRIYKGHSGIRFTGVPAPR